MATPKKPAKPKAKTSDPAIYTDPKLRDKLKVEIQSGDKGGEAGQWSARKSQLLAAAYKKAGGGYKKGPAKKTEGQKDLDQWGDEKWTTQDGEVAIRGRRDRPLPPGQSLGRPHTRRAQSHGVEEANGIEGGEAVCAQHDGRKKGSGQSHQIVINRSYSHHSPTTVDP